jgi:hypothetical protein
MSVPAASMSRNRSSKSSSFWRITCSLSTPRSVISGSSPGHTSSVATASRYSGVAKCSSVAITRCSLITHPTFRVRIGPLTGRFHICAFLPSFVGRVSDPSNPRGYARGRRGRVTSLPRPGGGRLGQGYRPPGTPGGRHLLACRGRPAPGRRSHRRRAGIGRSPRLKWSISVEDLGDHSPFRHGAGAGGDSHQFPVSEVRQSLDGVLAAVTGALGSSEGQTE